MWNALCALQTSLPSGPGREAGGGPRTATHTAPKPSPCPWLSLKSPGLVHGRSWGPGCLSCLWRGTATGQTARPCHHQPGAEASLGSRASHWTTAPGNGGQGCSESHLWLRRSRRPRGCRPWETWVDVKESSPEATKAPAPGSMGTAGRATEPSGLTPSSPGRTLRPEMRLLSISRDDSTMVCVSSRGGNWTMMVPGDRCGLGTHRAVRGCPGGAHRRERGPWRLPRGAHTR